MDTASFHFLLFGLAVAVVSNLNRSRVWRSTVLSLSSIAFLGLLAHGLFVFLPLAAFLLLGYGGLVAIERGWSKSMVWSILAVIFVYIWLKKYTFLPEGSFLHFPYFIIGLSYIFIRPPLLSGTLVTGIIFTRTLATRRTKTWRGWIASARSAPRTRSGRVLSARTRELRR